MDKPAAAFRVKDATGKTVGELSDACADMVLGRGLCGVPSSDKRCSRKQAELTLGRNGSLTLVPRGVNPAYLKRAADKGGEAVMLQRNEKYSLEDGDIFTLVANSYPFTVLRCSQERPAKEAPMKTSLVAAPKRVEPVKEGAKPSIDNGSKKGQSASEQANQKKWKCVECTFLNEAYTTFCDMCEASKKESPPTAAPAAAVPKPTPSSSLGTKRKAQDDDDEEEDTPRRSAPPERKRPKIDSEPEDERPVCPYGEACYRKNPAHFKENSHPWLEKKTKSMTTAKKLTAGHKDGEEKLAPAKPATKTEKPPKGSYTSDSAGPSNYGKEDIKKKKEEAPKPSEYESKKPSPKIPKGGDWMDEVPRPAPKKIEKPKPAQPSTPAPSQSTTSSKPSFSVPAQSQSTVSPSGKKTLKLIPPASPTKVAPGARLVLDYNSDEDEEEEIAPKQTGTSSSPQPKPPRPANVPVKKTPSLQSLAALLSDERGSTSTSTSVTSKPKNGNTAKQPATDTTQAVSKALAGSLTTAKGAKSLAFPSFGTSMLGMQPKRAAAVIRKTAKKFLRARADKDIRLVLVLEGKQDPVLVFFEEKGISDPRFTVATTPITKLDSVSLSSAFLATETDWRLRGGGTVSNRMVHEAAGPSLMQETKKLYSTASECGQVYPVPLPADSPLYLQQGVRAVVHCRPPNMNPAKPDCLNDEREGKRLLKETYKRLFQFFGATLDLL